MTALAVLDIAGTTVDEQGAVYTALEGAVRAAGASPSTTDIQCWMGADKKEAIAGLLENGTGQPPHPSVVESGFTDFHARLDAAYRSRPPRPLPGVPEAIAALRAADIKVALTTGFDRSVVDGLLDTIGWTSGVLDAVVCVDDVPAGRPAPYMIFRAMERTGVQAVADIVVAGDTRRDLEAGHNAGAGTIVGVLTGGYDVTDLGAVPHTHLLPSVADLPGLLGVAVPAQAATPSASSAE
ncbi:MULTISPECIES: phosphonatase-like hydrolase [Prauserella salsuginis group]|uniref:Phosphonatase-like hydrolase n=1 Tax=Prauserella salsuginis TaxID=387889 RepID=A0ABW6G0E8_9PSEU|nr:MULTISPECIES: phosphonatase-like hydrolase [Prauserella salsuginis group]MCR3721275.1 phosphonatase-like hydrolase [Prauserella flava]MCR3734645.1 phosphonatase-like hydrolase [Prauserella salsuginis]